MKRLFLSLAATVAAISAVPAQAAGTIIAPGTSGLTFTSFAADAATQGTVLATTSVSGTALTFSGILRSAVYLNTLGTIDFYYQVIRTGPGSATANNNQAIDAFTAADFSGWTVEGYVSATDPDGAGFFTAVNNPPSSTTTTGRSASGISLQTDFGANGLDGTENSATYIFRTNARNYTAGTFGVIDGSSYSGFAFAPAVGTVPEPATWGLMLAGFGIVGGALRRRKVNVAYSF